jgi:ribosome biogenesis GTPase
MTQTTAKVTAVHKERYELIPCRDGLRPSAGANSAPLYGRLKTGIYMNGMEPYPTVGDIVDILFNPQGDSVIIKTHSRRSYFSRLDPDPGGHREQAVAANFDYVFIMQSLNQDFNLRRMERYLALVWQSGATPVIVLTKADLTENPSRQLGEIESAAMGVDTVLVSAVTGSGLDGLEKYLQPGKTCVFLGSSGVGKSSLLNALMGADVMTVKAIREDDAKGRHTTTHRQLAALPNGACVIDTPGMRELGFWGEEGDEGISGIFSDIETVLGGCRFSDCRHQSEPGCAVRAAIERGDVAQERWESYQKLKREALYAENKAAAMREKSERNQHIAVWSRQRKKEVW